MNPSSPVSGLGLAIRATGAQPLVGLSYIWRGSDRSSVKSPKGAGTYHGLPSNWEIERQAATLEEVGGLRWRRLMHLEDEGLPMVFWDVSRRRASLAAGEARESS